MTSTPLLSCRLAVVAILGALAFVPQSAEAQFSNFLGCTNGEVVPREVSAQSNGDTQENTSSSKYDWSGGDTAATPAASVPCYARADGLWRETAEVILREDVDVSQWAGDPDLAALAHGKYTQPDLVILMPGDDGQSIKVYDASNPERVSHYIAQRDTALSQTLTTREANKLYHADEDALHGATLELSTTRSGRSELRLGDRLFQRPAAYVRFGHCAQGAPPSGDSIAAAFLRIENLRATQRGYDVVFQDPFYLLRNNKAAVFDTSERRCLIEALEVPKGWTLILEDAQGSMMHRSVMTSEQETQEIFGTTFGIGVEVAISGEAEDEGDDAGTVGSVGYGYEQAKKTVNAMREAKTVGSVMAYSRQKLMALVFNEGEVALSDQFVDLVYRIKSQPADDDRALNELVKTFGTHYAYGVTFGANARLTQSFTQESYLKKLREDESFKHTGGVQILAVSLEGTYGEMKGRSTETSETVTTENSTFVAVNGNGSWNENGYSAGQRPAPILLDLRSLDTLLTPVYFPDDPEIFLGVRARLAAHLDAYLERYESLLDATSLAPRPPAPDQNIYRAYEGAISAKLQGVLNKSTESMSLIVCKVDANTIEGLYIRDRDYLWKGKNYNGLVADKYKSFKLKRQDWNVFVKDGVGEITELVVRQDGNLSVEFGKQTYPNTWYQGSKPKGLLKFERNLRKYGTACYDMDELTELAGQEQ